MLAAGVLKQRYKIDRQNLKTKASKTETLDLCQR